MRKGRMDMDQDTSDLKALFKAEDAALNDDAFTGAVMKRVQASRRQRRMLLITAGAVGAAIAMTQLPALLTLVATYAAPVNDLASAVTSGERASASSAYGLLQDPPLWLVALAMGLAACATAIMPSETA